MHMPNTADYPYRLGPPGFPEAQALAEARAALLPIDREAVLHIALALTHDARSATPVFGLDVQAFLNAFPLDQTIGVNLLRLAEALPRIPDANNQIALLADTLSELDAQSLSAHHHWWDPAAAAALSMVQRVMPDAKKTAAGRSGGWLAQHLLRPVASATVSRLGGQFVFGQAIDSALDHARQHPSATVHYSFDMLGEGARGWQDAEQAMQRYADAIDGLSAAARTDPAFCADGISIKLSAIHPRLETAHYPSEKARLLSWLIPLCERAAEQGLPLTLDAEESERLELHVDIFAALAAQPTLDHWSGLGLAVQSYQLRALRVMQTVIELAQKRQARGAAPVTVRLVKGAYWDAEIKRAQELGLTHYPVFTAKAHTDLHYAACASRLLEHTDVLTPQFATHNTVTMALILHWTQSRSIAADAWEFQRLHGMGIGQYATLAQRHPQVHCRVYAPVGEERELLAYLIRRLLENGASTSFVRKLASQALRPRQLVEDELDAWLGPHPQPTLNAPTAWIHDRVGALGFDLSDPATLAPLAHTVATHPQGWHASPWIAGHSRRALGRSVHAPAHRNLNIGHVGEATARDVEAALASAWNTRWAWDQTPVAQRAAVLEHWAHALETHWREYVALCVWEAGKTLNDAIAEVREAIDFCRYYAVQARRLFEAPHMLPSPTGETNRLSWHGRGVFVAISPWNFPLAIFVGQIAAALVAGNPVIAKPAEQTPLIAYAAARHLSAALRRAHLPQGAFHLLPGPGETIGASLVADARIAGVVFTGGNATAKHIQKTLLEQHAAVLPLIAETGGLNAMLVDSTALLEQTVDAVMQSSFRSAGQRCSALRVLYVQEEIADRLLAKLRDAMALLHIGMPEYPTTDVGPLIDAAAQQALEDHIARMRQQGYAVTQTPFTLDAAQGYFLAPTLIEIDTLQTLTNEPFGPILHVLRYRLSDLDQVLETLDATGYGLTLGIQTRLDSRAEYIRQRIRVGNIYVNRNMIGAVVGVQPFGGEGLSGTGFKAGGPHTLLRFATERTYTVNTAAAGGNLSLLAGAPTGETP